MPPAAHNQPPLPPVEENRTAAMLLGVSVTFSTDARGIHFTVRGT